MARNRDLNTRLSQAPPQDEALGSNDGSKTMELRNLASHLLEMKDRIDSAITKPAQDNHNSSYSEQTMEISSVLITEEMLLRKAITNNEFSLYYQPIINFESKQIAGCEALVRWNHPS